MAKRPSNARTPTTGKEAEIVLPDIDLPEPVVGDVIDGTEDDIIDDEQDDADFDEDASNDNFEDEEVEDDAGDDDEEAAQDASDVRSADPTPAVAAAVRAARNAAAKKKVAEMPKAEKSKAEMIRDEIAKRQERGEDPIRPRDIVAALKTKGVTVHAPQVSVALRNATGSKPGKRASKAESGAEPKRVLTKSRGAEPAKKTPAPAAGEPNYSDLEAVGDFVLAHGGIERVRSLLNVFERIEKRFHAAN